MCKEHVSCPDCWTELCEADLKRIVTGELRTKYDEFQRQVKVDRDPHLHWWPQIDWDRYVFAIPDPHGRRTKAIWDWGYEFCIVCHEKWHPTKSCIKVREKGFRKFLKTRRVKRWPSCKTIIQKNSGWNHMTCHVCMHQFCWHCGQTYTPGHYNTFSTCSFEGEDRSDILIMLLILPLILFFIPFTIVFACRKVTKEWVKFPGFDCLSWLVAFCSAFVLGLLMQGLLPLAYCFLWVTYVQFHLKKCRYRF